MPRTSKSLRKHNEIYNSRAQTLDERYRMAMAMDIIDEGRETEENQAKTHNNENHFLL